MPLDPADLWLNTFSGKALHPFKPEPDQICIDDLAHARRNLPLDDDLRVSRNQELLAPRLRGRQADWLTEE